MTSLKKGFFKKYLLFVVALLVFGIVVDKASNLFDDRKITKIAEQLSNLPPNTTKIPIQTNSSQIPECIEGRCPIYKSFNVTGDHQSQTLIIAPMAMTHGAGRVMIVDKGKVIFESEELPQIEVKSDGEADGFYLIYENDIYTRNQTVVHYKYKDGKFKILEIT